MNLDNQIEKNSVRILLEAAKAFYENEENRKAYEAWKSTKEEDYADHRNIRLPGGVRQVHEA